MTRHDMTNCKTTENDDEKQNEKYQHENDKKKTEMDGIPKHDARISIVNIVHIGILRTGYLLNSINPIHRRPGVLVRILQSMSMFWIRLSYYCCTFTCGYFFDILIYVRCGSTPTNV